MSELSFMEKLLDGVEVEWKALGDVAEYSQKRVDASCLNASSFIGVDNLVAKKGGRVDATYLPNTARLTAYEKGDVLLGNIRPYLKKVWKATNSGGCSGDVLAVRIAENFKRIVSSDYLYYLLSADEFFSYNMQHAKGAKMPRGNKTAIMNYQIPIPCPDNPKKSLEIQAEIVRILDAFTAMTAELTAELTLRKQQYNHYRDQLLSFEEGEVEWKTLGELVDDKFWIMPATPKFDENEDIPYITSKNISGGHISFYKVKYISRQAHTDLSRNRPINCGDFLISMIGTIGEVARVKETDGDFYGQNMYLIRLNEDMLHAGYFLHFFDSPKMKRHFSSVKNNSGQGYLKANNIEDILVPTPSLDEQVRIASVLDKFDALTHSITEGLPREIELREKQYEYYRDLLLSFPKGTPSASGDEAA